MIALPPLLAEGLNAIVACVFPGTALTPVGTSGTVRGVTADSVDGGLLPCALLATILQLTVTPLVRPVTVTGELLPDPMLDPHVAV